MSPRLALPLLLLLACVAPSQAAQVNMRWDSCWGDGGVTNRAFACNTNAGSDLAVGSFIPPFAIDNAQIIFFRVLFATAGPSIQPWWQFVEPGTCRQLAISLEGAPPENAVTCADWDETAAIGLLVSYLPSQVYPYIASLVGRFDLPGGAVANLAGGQEYHLFSLRISHLRTVGTGACAGCALGACLWFPDMRIDTVNPPNQYFLYPLTTADRVDATVTWQGGGAGLCQFPVRSQRSTWGAVKSLYR